MAVSRPVDIHSGGMSVEEETRDHYSRKKAIVSTDPIGNLPA